jgi:spore maturation protein CgeB
VLVARDGAEVAAIVETLDADRAKQIGAAALKRVLAEHTYAHRARQVVEILEGLPVAGGRWPREFPEQRSGHRSPVTGNAS